MARHLRGGSSLHTWPGISEAGLAVGRYLAANGRLGDPPPGDFVRLGDTDPREDARLGDLDPRELPFCRRAGVCRSLLGRTRAVDGKKSPGIGRFLLQSVLSARFSY